MLLSRFMDKKIPTKYISEHLVASKVHGSRDNTGTAQYRANIPNANPDYLNRNQAIKQICVVSVDLRLYSAQRHVLC